MQNTFHNKRTPGTICALRTSELSHKLHANKSFCHVKVFQLKQFQSSLQITELKLSTRCNAKRTEGTSYWFYPSFNAQVLEMEQISQYKYLNRRCNFVLLVPIPKRTWISFTSWQGLAHLYSAKVGTACSLCFSNSIQIAPTWTTAKALCKWLSKFSINRQIINL